jgi:hypothetical protein
MRSVCSSMAASLLPISKKFLVDRLRGPGFILGEDLMTEENFKKATTSLIVVFLFVVGDCFADAALALDNPTSLTNRIYSFCAIVSLINVFQAMKEFEGPKNWATQACFALWTFSWITTAGMLVVGLWHYRLFGSW